MGCDRSDDDSGVIESAIKKPMVDSLNLTFIGSFESLSNSIVVSDPGYPLDSVINENLGVLLENCVAGTWYIYAEKAFRWHDEDVYSLVVSTNSEDSDDISKQKWENTRSKLAGDYGMSGVFDVTNYRNESLVPADYKWSWQGTPVDPSDLWFSLVADTITSVSSKNYGIDELPYGAILHWDGKIKLLLAADDNNEIAGIKLQPIK